MTNTLTDVINMSLTYKHDMCTSFKVINSLGEGD